MDAAKPEPMWNLMNCGLFFATLIVLFLTTCEFLTPLAIAAFSAMTTYQFQAHPSIPDKLIVIGTIGLLPSSVILFVILILQLCYPFSKPVLILRHVLNVSLTAFAVLNLISTRSSRQDPTLESFVSNCPDEDCILGAENFIATVFQNSKTMKIFISLYWAAIIFYSLPALGIVLFVPHVPLKK